MLLFIPMDEEQILELLHIYFAEFTASATKKNNCFLRYLFPRSWLWFYSSDSLWGIFFIFFFQFQSNLLKKHCFFWSTWFFWDADEWQMAVSKLIFVSLGLVFGWGPFKGFHHTVIFFCRNETWKTEIWIKV